MWASHLALPTSREELSSACSFLTLHTTADKPFFLSPFAFATHTVQSNKPFPECSLTMSKIVATKAAVLLPNDIVDRPKKACSWSITSPSEFWQESC